MAKMKDALFDVLEQSIDDEGLDSIEVAPELIAEATALAPIRLSETEVRRLAVALGRFRAETT